MYKKIAITVLALGTSALLNAGDAARSISDASEPFLGVEIGGTMVQGDTNGPLGELNHDSSSASIGVRLGAQNAQWRSMLMIDYFDSGEQNYERAMVLVDYFIMPSSFSTTAFRPYIGINGGYLNYEADDTVDASGMTYGAQAGFTAAISANVDFDLSYRYSVASPDEIDHIGNIAFGINYIY